MQNQILRFTAEAKAEGQTRSNEGGSVYIVDPFTHVERFLILGSTSTFYATGWKVTEEATRALDTAVALSPSRVMLMILDVNSKNRAMRRDPMLYALARLTLPDVPLETRRDAAHAVAIVARTGTDLLHWISYRRAMGKSNRLFRKAIQRWFLTRTPNDLALQAVKYDQRDGWSLRDALRLARPKAPNSDYQMIFDWIVNPQNRVPWAGRELSDPNAQRLFTGYSNLREASEWDSKALGHYVLANMTPRESIPAPLLARREVWEALFPDMPGMALLRNMGKLQNVGVFESQENRDLAMQKISKATKHLHPFHFLISGFMYRKGHGVKGKLTWSPQPDLVEALAGAFGDAFGNLPVNDTIRPLVALDVSGSMSQPAGGTVLSCYEAEAALALVLAYQFPKAEFVVFSHGITPFSAVGGFDDLMRAMRNSGHMFGWTYVDLPLHAAYKSIANNSNVDHWYDAAITITDSETANSTGKTPAEWVGEIHKLHPEFRSAIVAMATNGISVANPNDDKQMDFVGLDASLPVALGDFLSGRI